MRRRLFSLVLLVTLGLPAWAPLLALGETPESALPACCRRDGKHHCAMSMTAIAASSQAADKQTAKWSAPRERCPYDPATVSVAYQHPVGGASASAAVFAGAFFARPLGPVQTESKRRIAQDRSRQKRGPPAYRFATNRHA